MRNLAWWLGFVGAVGFAVWVIETTSPGLPDRVAMHFDGDGMPGRFAAREAYVAAFHTLISIMAGVMALVAKGMSVLPMHLINMPNREYWLDPRRQQQTRDYLVRWSIVSAVLMQFFLIGMHLCIVDAHRLQPIRLGEPFWWVVGIFVLSILAMIVIMVRRFSSSRR